MKFYAPERIELPTRTLVAERWYELRGREKRHDRVQEILNGYFE